MNATTKTGDCYKCNGLGSLRAFAHIHNGKCFACGGTGRAKVTARSEGPIAGYARDAFDLEARIAQLKAEEKTGVVDWSKWSR